MRDFKVAGVCRVVLSGVPSFWLAIRAAGGVGRRVVQVVDSFVC